MTDKTEAREDKPEAAAGERTLGNQILVGRVDAAFLLGVSPRTIDNLVLRGQLRARKVGARVLFLRETLERFARRRE